MSSKIEQLQKQNDGMYNNLVKNNVSFTRQAPLPDEDLLVFYQNELKQLREALVEFKKQQPKPEPKPKVAPPPPKEVVPKVKKAIKDEAEEDDEVPVDKKPSYPTLGNMEDLKRSFCNNELDEFKKFVGEQPYLFYRANYKFADDMDGKADYVARNFVKGFIKNLDDYRKYFFNCFRCYDKDKKYSYPSWWIVNTTTELATVLGDYVDDFTFTQVPTDEVEQFLQEFQKVPEDTVLAEAYLH